MYDTPLKLHLFSVGHNFTQTMPSFSLDFINNAQGIPFF